MAPQIVVEVYLPAIGSSKAVTSIFRYFMKLQMILILTIAQEDALTSEVRPGRTQ
jgi:hypothetical protein